jgi:cation transport ATPase
LWLSLERAAESGVILRSTAALERLAKVGYVYFDKTGTLTQLPMKVQGIYIDSTTVLAGHDEFLQIVASIENQSEHPLARAIVEYAKANHVEIIKTQSFKAIPAMGVAAKLSQQDGCSHTSTGYAKVVVIGSERMMSAEGLEMPTDVSEHASAWKEAGHLVVYAGWDGVVRGIIALGETVRAEAGEALNQLRSRGLELGVLTGDESKSGERWQRLLGIPVQAALSPDEKMKRLAENAAMVGDGINDGPALASTKWAGAESRNRCGAHRRRRWRWRRFAGHPVAV